ncbi:hypothetical protein U0070_009759, partial [Myodes glareolus]
MDKKFLANSLGITWQQLSRADWAEASQFPSRALPGAPAWNVDLFPVAERVKGHSSYLGTKGLPSKENTAESNERRMRSPQGRQPKIVVIRGIPGIGKTTLARKMMLMWAHNEFYAHKFKFAFCFHCRELNWVGERSFSELIGGQRLRSQALVSKILSRPDQLLLLLDDFEELTSSLITRPADLVEDWNQNLLSKRMLPEATLLILVRPTSWRGVELLVKCPSHVTLTGFSRTETLDYLRLYFRGKMTRNQVVDFAMKNTILLSMCQVHVVCWTVCHCLRKLMQKMVNLTKACPNATSVCVLYLATLFPTVCKKLSGSNYQKQLEGVCRLTVQDVWDLKSVFDKTDFQHVKVDEATIDTFLQVNVLRKLEDQGDRYVFALFSFQEFFGALFYVLISPQRIVYYHPLSQVSIQDLIAMSRAREGCETQMGLFFFGLLNEACAGIVMRSFKCRLALGNKLKAINVITQLNDYGCCDCSQLFPCLTEIAEKSFVSSALESYQKVSETQEPEGPSTRVTTTVKKPQCKVQRLQLKTCEATFRDWIQLTSSLQRNMHLKTLLLRASSPDIFGLKYLLLSYLRELMLENCNLTEASCEEITSSLRHSKMLTHLSLKDAGSRHIWTCCKYMMSSFKNNQSLRSLTLSFNRLMDGGVSLLCSALADAGCSLLVLELEQYLDLSKNIIGINDMLVLALVFLSQRHAEEVVLKKKSNEAEVLKKKSN